MSEHAEVKQTETIITPQAETITERRTVPIHTTSYRHTEHATILFRPIEGKFWKDNPTTKMDPYCKFKLGWHRAKSSVANEGGGHSFWHDIIPLERKHGEHFAKLKCKNRDGVRKENIGSCKIDLDEVVRERKVRQWLPLMKGDNVTGEILVDMEYIEHSKPLSTVP